MGASTAVQKTLPIANTIAATAPDTSRTLTEKAGASDLSSLKLPPRPSSAESSGFSGVFSEHNNLAEIERQTRNARINSALEVPWVEPHAIEGEIPMPNLVVDLEFLKK